MSKLRFVRGKTDLQFAVVFGNRNFGLRDQIVKKLEEIGYKKYREEAGHILIKTYNNGDFNSLPSSYELGYTTYSAQEFLDAEIIEPPKGFQTLYRNGSTIHFKNGEILVKISDSECRWVNYANTDENKKASSPFEYWVNNFFSEGKQVTEPID